MRSGLRFVCISQLRDAVNVQQKIVPFFQLIESFTQNMKKKFNYTTLDVTGVTRELMSLLEAWGFFIDLFNELNTLDLDHSGQGGVLTISGYADEAVKAKVNNGTR